MTVDRNTPYIEVLKSELKNLNRKISEVMKVMSERVRGGEGTGSYREGEIPKSKKIEYK